jgi:hypothetical protein
MTGKGFGLQNSVWAQFFYPHQPFTPFLGWSRIIMASVLVFVGFDEPMTKGQADSMLAPLRRLRI